MSIPKKGVRKIIVAEESFIWLIRRKATNWQAYYPEGCICVVVVKHAQEPGSLLVVSTDLEFDIDRVSMASYKHDI